MIQQTATNFCETRLLSVSCSNTIERGQINQLGLDHGKQESQLTKVLCIRSRELMPDRALLVLWHS